MRKNKKKTKRENMRIVPPTTLTVTGAYFGTTSSGNKD